MVERQAELRRIADAWRRPGLRALVVDGPAGVGKTRLAREAVRQADGQGVPVRWVVATRAAQGLPFAAVANLLPDAGVAAADPAVLLTAARHSLGQATGGRRVLLGVDDAHLLDDASVTLVHHLVATGAVFLLCTVRSGETVPDAITSLLRTGDGQTVTLGTLSQPAVTELLTGALGGPLDAAAAHRLWRVSEGNALLLRELVADARAHGALAELAGLWRLADDWAPGGTLPDLVRARLGGLAADEHQVVQAVALAEPLETELLESLFDPGVLAAVDAAAVLEPVPDRRRHRVRLVHPLYSEALRDAVPPLRARALHRRLAGALQGRGARRRQDALRLGTWWLQAGEAGDPAVFTTAAWQAAALFDAVLAERLARAATQAGAGFGAQLALAHALRMQGRAEEVAAALDGWETDAATDRERAQAAHLMAFVLVRDDLRLDDAEELLGKANALVSDGVARQEIAAAHAELAAWRWRHAEVLELAWPVATDPRATPAAAAAAMELAAGALAVAGRGDEVLALVEPALARARDDPGAGAIEDAALVWVVLGHVFAGRVDAGERLGRDRLQRALDTRALQPQVWWTNGLGILALLTGRPETAARLLREMLALIAPWPRLLTGMARCWALGALAEALALMGDVAGAEAALAEAAAAVPAAIPVGPRARGAVWVRAAWGEVTAAREATLVAADGARQGAAHGFEALALHDAVRLGASGAELEVVADRLSALVERTDGALVPALAAHAVAVRAGDAGALERVAATLDDLGFVLRAAEAACQAAALYRAGGRAASASAATHRARALADRCEGARTPALVLDAGSTPLTTREREIVAMAASGLSNRDIAARLVLSVRTVDNHLHRAYAKLGVTGRTALDPAPDR